MEKRLVHSNPIIEEIDNYNFRSFGEINNFSTQINSKLKFEKRKLFHTEYQSAASMACKLETLKFLAEAGVDSKGLCCLNSAGIPLDENFISSIIWYLIDPEKDYQLKEQYKVVFRDNDILINTEKTGLELLSIEKDGKKIYPPEAEIA